MRVRDVVTVIFSVIAFGVGIVFLWGLMFPESTATTTTQFVVSIPDTTEGLTTTTTISDREAYCQGVEKGTQFAVVVLANMNIEVPSDWAVPCDEMPPELEGTGYASAFCHGHLFGHVATGLQFLGPEAVPSGEALEAWITRETEACIIQMGQ